MLGLATGRPESQACLQEGFRAWGIGEKAAEDSRCIGTVACNILLVDEILHHPGALNYCHA